VFDHEVELFERSLVGDDLPSSPGRRRRPPETSLDERRVQASDHSGSSSRAGPDPVNGRPDHLSTTSIELPSHDGSPTSRVADVWQSARSLL
jgi:hypothetical protein